MKGTTKNIYHERIHCVLLHIQSNLDGDLSLETLAEQSHFSPIHFHRVFKGMIGETVVEHVRRIRLERAAMRLVVGSTTVTDAAFDAGYETVESFSRSFKKMFSCPPSKYQAKLWDQWYQKIPGNIHYLPEDSRPNLALQQRTETTMEVQIEQLEPLRVAYIRHIGPYNQCGDAWARLASWGYTKGIFNVPFKSIGVCYDDPDVTPAEKIRYDACITVDSSVKSEGEVGIQELAGGEYAMALHKGPYENLEASYAELMGVWLPESGRDFREEPSFELYLNDPTDTPPDELLTKIYIPLK